MAARPVYSHRFVYSEVSGGIWKQWRVPEGKRAPAMLRLSPGVKPDTHDHISTGQLDSKFGFSIESGAARKAVETALRHPRLEVVGLHSHIGSQIFALRAYEEAMDIMLGLLAELRDTLGYEPRKLGAGGGRPCRGAAPALAQPRPARSRPRRDAPHPPRLGDAAVKGEALKETLR